MLSIPIGINPTIVIDSIRPQGEYPI